jgi:hypothetical protein
MSSQWTGGAVSEGEVVFSVLFACGPAGSAIVVGAHATIRQKTSLAFSLLAW